MKSILIRIVIAGLIIIGAACFAIFSKPIGIPVLNYHQINDVDENMLTVSTSEFEAQMAWLEENGYKTITASELADALEGKGALPEHRSARGSERSGMTRACGSVRGAQGERPCFKRWDRGILPVASWVSV